MDAIDEYKLMNAANDYGMNIRKGYPRVMDETDVYIRNAFEAGARWAAANIQSAIPTNQKKPYSNEDRSTNNRSVSTNE